MVGNDGFAAPQPIDLPTALRLAGALFPDGAQKRIVLLSDGKPTQGRTTDPDAIIAREDIDCVIVCTTTPHLARYAIAALEVMKASPEACSVSDSLMVKASAGLPPFSRMPSAPGKAI